MSNIIPSERLNGLFENAKFKIDGTTYTIYPNGASDGDTKTQHSIRIKITKNKNTRGALSVAINQNGTINYDSIKYGNEFKGSELSKIIDNLGGLAVYALSELINVYNEATPETVLDFKNKTDEFNKLSSKERKQYIKMAKGDI